MCDICYVSLTFCWSCDKIIWQKTVKCCSLSPVYKMWCDWTLWQKFGVAHCLLIMRCDVIMLYSCEMQSTTCLLLITTWKWICQQKNLLQAVFYTIKSNWNFCTPNLHDTYFLFIIEHDVMRVFCNLLTLWWLDVRNCLGKVCAAPHYLLFTRCCNSLAKIDM